MATYSWSVPASDVISGATYIKDTDNKIQNTMNDLADFVNGSGNHTGQGLTYDLVDKASVQTITGQKTFTQPIIADVQGNVIGQVSGNIDTATALETPRNITLTGDVSGSASFNGTADAIINATISVSSHGHAISDISLLQDALDAKQDAATAVSTTSPQLLLNGDYYRLSSSTTYASLSQASMSIYRGDGVADTIGVPNTGLVLMNKVNVLDTTNTGTVTSSVSTSIFGGKTPSFVSYEIRAFGGTYYDVRAFGVAAGNASDGTKLVLGTNADDTDQGQVSNLRAASSFVLPFQSAQQFYIEFVGQFATGTTPRVIVDVVGYQL